MGRAIDTLLGQVTNSAALTAVTMAAGDSLQVKQFSDTSKAVLENVIIKGGQVTTARILSPSLHDPVRGITLLSAQAPTTFSLPREVGQPLTKGDTLILQGNSGAANSSVFALQHYYEDLNGTDANLVHWSDISSYIVNVKPQEVDVTASATIGQWNDTAMTTTENALHANRWYAILGYNVDVACGVVAVRGPDLGNLRVGGPGSVLQGFTADYFAAESDRTQRPHIPVFNANNAGGMTVSVADNAASTAVKVQLILAELDKSYVQS
jgi:hypothetical protein